DNWCCSVKLSMSAEKTTLIYFHNQIHLPVIYNGSPLNIANQIKILGVKFADHKRNKHKLNFSSHIDDTITQCTKIKNILFSICKRSWGFDSRKRLVLYKSLIRSKMLYASEIWSRFLTNRSTRKLHSLQHNILTSVVQGYRTISYECSH